ncbi:uncharacterized protein LOC141702917 [Apium graveolens]|uniref:uncharacterized protein LOC141702917 n=1 Tax=Apium graveolens TaxID=4045 RepID=UPI003D7A4820
MAETSNQRLKLARLSTQVTWSSPNSKKGNGDKGKGNKRVRTNEYIKRYAHYYERWDCHGEKDVLRNDVGTSFGNTSYRDDDMYDTHDDDFEDCEDFDEEPNAKAKEFNEMVNTASEPIYPNNANFTILEFIMELLHWKNRHNCSNNGFDDLLHLIGLVFPNDHKLPEKYYTVRKMIRGLNMEYEKIDACENDCMLFYKEHSEKTKCDICKRDRYKVQKDPKKQKISRKILRYFPITTRLQRLFMAEKTAKCMRWHHDRVVVEGQLSHPADGDEWKQFDRRFTRFSKRLEMLDSDYVLIGFDPFHDAHAKEYTVWPVVIVVYNLPPSMCTKAPYMFMPLLIPGPIDPTKDLHVYLRPLIDELKFLWHTGVETYDIYSRKLACPVCMGEVKAKQLKHGGKSTFYGTARYFLEADDPLRRSTRVGIIETRTFCAKHSGSFAKTMCEQIQFPPSGKSTKRKPRDYGKSKEYTKARKDCKELSVHRDLWIQDDCTEPHALYALSKEQIHKLFKWIEELQPPDGYASNISRCVNWKKNCIRGMKAHDCHVFMQKLLPIICRDLLPKHVADPIIELCNFFQDYARQILKYSNIVRIMSKLETVFIPGFFDPMEHLPLHLATECKLGGPANGRWMYFVERYLHNLKLKVGNKARAEGSMAQRYIEEESVHFCSVFFNSKVVYGQLRRNEAPRKFHDVELLEVYTYMTHPSLQSRDRILNGDEHELVAYYVLINSSEVGNGFQKLVQQHYPLLNDTEKEQYQKENFKDWFERRVQDDEELKKKFLDLIRGPMFKVESYKACKCNGYKFSCPNDKELTSTNSGTSYNETYRNYYGRVEEILKLFYHNGHQVIVFKCHWFDHTTHVKVDRHRMTTVDVKSKLNVDDVFVLASQAHQVYYAPNILNAKSSWMFENDYSIHHDDEEESKNDKEVEDEDEENGTENDEFSDDDDLV